MCYIVNYWKAREPTCGYRPCSAVREGQMSYDSGRFRDSDDGGFALIMGGIIAVVLIVAGLVLCDSVGLPAQHCVGTIVERQFTEAHTVMVYHRVGKYGGFYTPVHYPDKWSVNVRAIEKTDWVEISHDQYDNVHVDSTVDVDYGVGRLFGDLQVTAIHLR